MATVGYKQVTAALIRPGETAGACSFCDWSGPWHPQSELNRAAEEARTHLGAEHPAEVRYWNDLL